MEVIRGMGDKEQTVRGPAISHRKARPSWPGFFVFIVGRDWQAWDEQTERDFSAGGGGMPLLAELERKISEGKTRPMEEGFAERRKSRQ